MVYPAQVLMATTGSTRPEEPLGEIVPTIRAPIVVPAPSRVPMNNPLSSLRVYDSSSASEGEDYEDSTSEGPTRPPEDDASGVIITDVMEYRRRSSTSSSSSASTSEESSVEDLGGGSECEGAAVGGECPKSKPHDKNDELSLDQLPPVDISSLTLNIKEEDCLHMGNIISIVDRLVMVQALPDMPAYDLDTLLFLDKGKRPLGHVFDVIGQVTSPMYAIRFNSKEEIESKDIKKEQAVYSVPNNTEHTQYVFLKQLMKMKGSDASWKNDSEVPTEFVDFSDDEMEYTYAKQHFNETDTFDNRRKRNSLERHRMFESAMNLKNKVDTARRRMHERREAPPQKRYAPQTLPQQQMQPQQLPLPPQTQNLYFPPPPAQCTPFAPPPFLAPPPNLQFLRMPPPMFGMPPPFPSPFGPPIPAFTHAQPFATFGPPAIPPMPAQALPNFSGAPPSHPPPPPPHKSYQTALSLPKQSIQFATATPSAPPQFAIPMQQWGYGGGVACSARPFPPQKGGLRKPFPKR